MVDALSRAHRWLTDEGCLVDLRPADVVAHVQIGLPNGTCVEAGGLVVQAERRFKHAAADVALQTLLDRGVFALESERRFDFYRYADSPDEMRDYIATEWQHSRMDAATHVRAVDILRRHPQGRVQLIERVGIRKLRPGARGFSRA
ncbi:MAG TPA: hypothetical protein VGY57_08215 [Vicinamibacterales bacterium]|nr:hypothetical protein [Vicinamibacterales bacterium]